MTVAQVGYTQAEYVEDGGQAIAWPSGAAVGLTAVVDTCTGPGRKPATVLPGGWQLLRSDSSGMASYGKLSLTADDIADDLDLNAVVAGLSVYSGVVGFGGSTAKAGATIATVGDAFHTFGSIIAYDPDALTPPDGRINATDALIEHWTKVRISAKKSKWKQRRFNAWSTVPSTTGYHELSTNASNAFSVLLLGTLPTTETSVDDVALVTPTDGDVIKLDSAYSFRFTYSAAWGVDEASLLWNYREVRLREEGSSTWGTVKAGVWYPSTTSNPEASTSRTVPLGNYLSATTVYEWQVRIGYGTLPLAPTWSDWSDVAAFTVVTAPTVSSVSMTSSLTPTVSWSVTGTQMSYRVRVLDVDGLPVYNSGTVASAATSADIPQQDWTNGADYTAEVTVWSDFGLQSAAVEGSAVTISWTPPASPTAIAQSSSRPMTVTASGLTSSHNEVRCTWVANGTTYSVTLPVVEGSVVFDLPLAPYGVVTTYSVDASEISGDVELWSDPVTVTASCYDTATYLTSDDLTGWLQVCIAEDGDRADTAGVLTSYPLGASRPVVIRTPSMGAIGTTTLLVSSQEDKEALRAWLDANSVFWMRWPPERDDSQVYADVPPTRMALSSPWSESRRTQEPLQYRRVPLSWVEQ